MLSLNFLAAIGAASLLMGTIRFVLVWRRVRHLFRQARY